MKILYGVTKSQPFGGAQHYVFDLATEMKKQGHDATVLCGGQGALVEKLKGEGVRVISLKRLKRDISVAKEFFAFFDIWKILREERPDIFHINSSKMGGLGSLTGRLVGIKKVIFTTHGWAFNESRPWWQKIFIKFFTWLTILLAHKTICVSEKTKADVSKWPFIKNKLVVVYNGIKEFDLVGRKDKSFTVGTIAELHRIKGLDILLTAWSKFVKRHQAKLVIIGGGEERQNLENMAKNLNISSSVTFSGFVDNARSLLSNFDIFCMPSRSEAMPYVLLEAGLAELPVIATAVGGIPEVIDASISGVLVPVGDVEVLYSTLVLLAENGDLRKRLGSELKKEVEEKFSFERMVHDTLEVYES